MNLFEVVGRQAEACRDRRLNNLVRQRMACLRAHNSVGLRGLVAPVVVDPVGRGMEVRPWIRW